MDAGSRSHATLTDHVLEAAARSARGAPPEARDMVIACLLDWTACAIAGAEEPLVSKLLADAQEFGRPGSTPLAGRSERLGLRDAVMVNGAAGHALDYDDGLPAMKGHPSVAIAPALLGLAGPAGTRGADLVTAYIFAVDVAARVGLLLTPDHYQRGFHGTATAGAIGAAAGCAWMLGLADDRRAHAIGIAAARAAGLKASFGSETKPLQPGWAALTGLVSAQWAARGLTAQRDPLGHPAGLRALSDSFDPDAALDTASAHILNVRFKRHAACAGTHPTIEAILALVRDHDLRPDQVARATIRVDRRLDSVCNQQDVRSGLQAKFSLRMVAAMALSGIDTAAPASFSDMCVADPAIRTMFARMTVELGEDPRTSFSQVSLVLTDGRNLQAECDLTQSDTRAEMQAVRPKFSALVAPALGNDGAARLASAINQLDPLGDPTTILERARKPG